MSVPKDARMLKTSFDCLQNGWGLDEVDIRIAGSTAFSHSIMEKATPRTHLRTRPTTTTQPIGPIHKPSHPLRSYLPAYKIPTWLIEQYRFNACTRTWLDLHRLLHFLALNGRQSMV